MHLNKNVKVNFLIKRNRFTNFRNGIEQLTQRFSSTSNWNSGVEVWTRKKNRFKIVIEPLYTTNMVNLILEEN